MNIEHQYLSLLYDILSNGYVKNDRTGTGTVSIFGRQIRHSMSKGFPLLTTKKMAWKQVVTELLWFLKGDTNIKYLVDNGCNIWNGDAYKAYCKNWGGQNKYSVKTPILENGVVVGSSNRKFTQEEFINKIKTDDEFAKKWGELGPIYGKQWRNWETTNVKCRKFEEIYSISDDSIVIEKSTVDQIANLINELKTNPDSRRLMVNAWNVAELDQMVLPPCHYGFQVYTRELSMEERLEIFIKSQNLKEYEGEVQEIIDMNNTPKRAISLMWNQRSVDTFLGLPFNIASYGLLLELIAKAVNMVPDELIGNLGDVHLYKNHIEQAKEQLSREPRKLPKLCLDYRDGEYDKNLKGFVYEDFSLFDYNPHPPIKAPLSN